MEDSRDIYMNRFHSLEIRRDWKNWGERNEIPEGQGVGQRVNFFLFFSFPFDRYFRESNSRSINSQVFDSSCLLLRDFPCFF